ncbi:putative zinc transporter [Cavenderia fasciculata]|uniref:Zinc transporter n=1 Tax=Cavenderia fasciculata TaxID=261658 RepID=F4QA98_CACFS|nr:putative zinc transporter [Cavenderia fasciculata]EGG15617.1 putative zinc transporter [Cavenderia fasciculata]|eukprot:XP_004354359.1 putative zinc transporter [Cavenderia fasciculata]
MNNNKEQEDEDINQGDNERLVFNNNNNNNNNGDKKKKKHGHSHGNDGGHGHSHGGHKEKKGGHSHLHNHQEDEDEHHHHNHNHNHDDHDDDEDEDIYNSSTSIEHIGGVAHSLGSSSLDSDEAEETPLDESKSLQEIQKKRRARLSLMVCLVLTTIFMIGEIVGGYIANSLAIMTDAAHLLTDIGAMFLSLFAMWISSQPPTSKLSFGFHRAEILGALVSVLMIWALTGVLMYEAIQRILHPPDVVDGKIMFIIATCGLAINVIDALILHFGAGGHGHSHGGINHGHSHGGGGGHNHGDASKKKKKHGHSHSSHGHGHEIEEIDIEKGLTINSRTGAPKKESKIKMDINVYSTYIHVIGDCFQSIGVMIAAAIIWIKPHWKIADPITTFIFSIIVLFTTIRLLRQSLGVLMEGVPADISVAEVQHDLEALEGVFEVHDLHIWSITLGKPALSVHLTVGLGVVGDDVLKSANRLLKQEHNIDHTTIQIEIQDRATDLCRDPCAPTPKKALTNLQQRILNK